MSKIDKFLSGLSRTELLATIKAAAAELKSRRAFYIKHLTKKCGHRDCRCYQGFEHGPYAYLLHTDASGKQIQKSLGRVLIDEDFRAMAEEEQPSPVTFRLSDRQVSRVAEEDRWGQGIRLTRLTQHGFEKLHEMRRDEDTMDRKTEIWIDHRKYEKALALWNDRQEIALSQWGVHGVGTKKGIATLDALVEQGYYFSP